MNPQRILNQLSTRGSEIVPIGLGPILKYYSIICEQKELKSFFLPVISDYIRDVRLSRNCELCKRSKFALTAHHLVPRSVLKKGSKQELHQNQK